MRIDSIGDARRAASRGLLVGCMLAASLASAAENLRSVTVGAPSPWSPVSAAVFYGIRLGFFAEEGMQPEMLTFQGSAVLLPQVVNKSLTFALVNPDSMAVALDKKEPYPVKFFYNAYRENSFEFVVKEDSGIRQLQDLKGKKLGVGALTWGNIPLSRAVLARAGLAWQKDVEAVPVGLGPAAWQRLQSGQVAALNLFIQEDELMTLAGIKVRRLPTPPEYRSVFGAGFVAHVDTLKKDPKLVAGFGRARAKSEVACMANPRACLQAWLDANPSLRPTSADEPAWVERNLHLLQANFAITGKFPPGEPKRWGAFPAHSWETLLTLMHEGGQISSSNLDTAQLFTADYVDEMNRFDAAAVEGRARAH